MCRDPDCVWQWDHTDSLQHVHKEPRSPIGSKARKKRKMPEWLNRLRTWPQ